jgi:protein required for attachment to host cells
MTTTWIVAADSSRARVLQVADPEKKLVEIDALLNPEGRLNEREINTDAHGRFPGTPGGSTAEDDVGAVEHQTELFAKRIGDYLEKARTDRRYDRVCLIAPPKFLGALRKEIGKEVQKLVVDERDKDLSWLSAREIERHVAKGGPS